MKCRAFAFTAVVAACLVVNYAAAGPFRLGTRLDIIPERGQVTYTVVNTDRQQYSFMPPSDWKMSADAAAGVITWTSPDYRSMLRIKIVDGNGDTKPELKPDELRQKSLEELPDAKVTGELPCYAAGTTGRAFDLERTVDRKFLVTTRLAFVPVAGGFVHLNLTAPKDEFFKKQNELSHFLNSFSIAKAPSE